MNGWWVSAGLYLCGAAVMAMLVLLVSAHNPDERKIGPGGVLFLAAGWPFVAVGVGLFVGVGQITGHTDGFLWNRIERGE